MLGLVISMMLLWVDPPGPPAPSTSAVPLETLCRVQVAGMPASVRGEHELVWPGGRVDVDDVVDVRFRGADASVAIRGPRYQGWSLLSATRCSAAVQRIDAKPRPATLEFRCAPPKLVVRCTRCPGVGEGWIPADSFPALAMTAYIREVDLEFKAAGYSGSRRRLILYPGRNLVDVVLERLR